MKQITSQRLMEMMFKREIGQSELARRVGATQGAIQQLATGKSRTSRFLPAIARELGVSEAWLRGESDHKAPSMSIEDAAEEIGFTRIREVDVGYAMGGGSFIEDQPESRLSVFDTTWLRRLTKSPDNLLFVARGIGDSMMPTLLDNDTLIIDRGRQRIDQQDRIWALAYGELGMIKRVRRLPSGQYLLMSDNATVTPIEASPDELHVVGRLIWIGRAA